MVRRLLAGGFEVVVFDRDRAAAEAFRSHDGATVATSLAAIGQTCDVTITMLPDGDAVRSVIADADAGLVTHAAPGSTFIDMSSCDPGGTQELAGWLADRNMTLIDAPVSGGVSKAQSGELAILIGGAADIVDRHRPIFEQLGGTTFHTGDVGTGHAMKALNNLLSAAGLLAAAEVFMIGSRFGLTPELMLEVLNASTGRNNSTERKFGPFVLTGSYDSGFALSHMVKDLRIALSLAERTDTPVTLSQEVVDRYAQAHEALAPEADHTAIAQWVQDVVGSRFDGGDSRR